MTKTKHAAKIAACALTLAGIFAAAPLAADSEIITAEAKASFYADEFNGRPTSSGEIFDMNAFTAAHKTLPFGTMLVVTNLDNGKKAVVRVNDRGPFVEDRELDVSKGAAEALGMISSGTARVSIVKVDGADLAAAQTEATNEQTTVATQSPASADAAVASTATSAAAETTATPATAVTPATTENTATAATPTASEATPTATVVATPAPVSTPATSAATKAIAAAPAAAVVATPVPSNATTWRIQLGAFSHEDNALRLVAKLRKDGFQPAFEKTTGVTRVVIPGIVDSGLSALRVKLEKAGYTGFIVRKES